MLASMETEQCQPFHLMQGPPRAPLDKLLDVIKPSAKPPPVVSVDIPSGMSSRVRCHAAKLKLWTFAMSRVDNDVGHSVQGGMWSRAMSMVMASSRTC